MIRYIKDQDKILSIHIKSKNLLKEKAKYNFPTPENSFLQVGVNKYKAGDKVPNHIHLRHERMVNRTEEVIYLQRGKIRVSIFNNDQIEIDTFEVEEGDVLITLEGGHGFEFIEESEIIEVKQGPYVSKEFDKMSF